MVRAPVRIYVMRMSPFGGLFFGLFLSVTLLVQVASYHTLFLTHEHLFLGARGWTFLIIVRISTENVLKMFLDLILVKATGSRISGSRQP